MELSTQPPPPSGPADFQKLLDDWSQAIVENDADKFRHFPTSDWQLVDTNGIIPLDRFLEVVKSGDLEHDEMTHEVTSVQHIHDVAIVVTHGRNHGRWQGKAFSADEWTTEIFVWQDNRWVCHHTSLTPRHSSSD